MEREGVRNHAGATNQGQKQVQLQGLPTDHLRGENLPAELPEHPITPTAQKQHRPMINMYKYRDLDFTMLRMHHLEYILLLYGRYLSLSYGAQDGRICRLL